MYIKLARSREQEKAKATVTKIESKQEKTDKDLEEIG
jgi:hypothetical protein